MNRPCGVVEEVRPGAGVLDLMNDNCNVLLVRCWRIRSLTTTDDAS